MTEAEFKHRLRRLVAEARDRNAPITGAYTVRSPDPGVQDYDITFTEVTNRLLDDPADTFGE